MPKRTDIKSILIIGAGPIIIGQACEFDYSGAQACKALKEEGYRVILVNSNPATIMTDPVMADATYIEPITWQTVEQIIAKERPDAILPTMGGQTALNCALDLDKHGVLTKYDCELIGATKDSIEMAEDRDLFDKAMKRIGLECPRAETAETMEEAFATQEKMGYPVSFALHSQWVVQAAVLRIIAMSLSRFVSAVLICHQTISYLSMSHSSVGKSTRWKWSVIKTITASSSAPLKTLTQWVFIRVTQLQLPQRIH